MVVLFMANVPMCRIRQKITLFNKSKKNMEQNLVPNHGAKNAGLAQFFGTVFEQVWKPKRGEF